MEWIGLAIFLVAIFGGGAILSAIKEYGRQKHIERIIAQLPDAERGQFLRDYLSNPKSVISKLAKANE